MKNLTMAIVITAAAISGTSCKKDVIGEGPVATETRSIGAFDAIDLQMNGNVYYKNATHRNIEVSAKKSIHSQLETAVQDGRLVIRYRNGKTYDADESIRITVTGPDVNAFMLNTSGSIYALNDVTTSTLVLRSNGSGNIALKGVNAHTIDAESNQSGHITADFGAAENVRAKSDASGKINLSAVSAKDATAKIVGSGDIYVKVSANLDATIKGSGTIYFTGYPMLSTHISGSGRLVRL